MEDRACSILVRFGDERSAWAWTGDHATGRRRRGGRGRRGAAALALRVARPGECAARPGGTAILGVVDRNRGRQRLQKVVDRGNTTQGEQDKAWVHLVPVSDITSKAMVAIGGGDPPDLVGLYSYSVPGYAEAKAAMRLDQFTGWSERVAPLPYLRGVRDLLEHDGHQWAGVNTCYTLAMYYNRAMLREIGKDADRPPRTIAELDECSDAMTRYEPGDKTRLARAGFLANVPGWWNYFWPQHHVPSSAVRRSSTTKRHDRHETPCIACVPVAEGAPPAGSGVGGDAPRSPPATGGTYTRPRTRLSPGEWA